jgi:hypothetical protein
MAGGAGAIVRSAPPEVDVPTAKELIEQIHQHVAVEELGALIGELQDKVAAVRALLFADELDVERVRRALAWTFVARRRASAILGARSDADLVAWVEDLLHGSDQIAKRFDRFCAGAGPLDDGAASELASELLHFSCPERHWLWSRWVWSPDSRTGALPLLIGEDYELDADGLGAGYVRVSEALVVLDASPEASAFRLQGGGRLATDVLLACSYGVYMRTVLGLKMTQEFNALVPPMAQLVRRLLGIYRNEEGACQSEV